MTLCVCVCVCVFSVCVRERERERVCVTVSCVCVCACSDDIKSQIKHIRLHSLTAWYKSHPLTGACSDGCKDITHCRFNILSSLNLLVTKVTDSY